MAQLTDDLILCTRNRPEDVHRCLESVFACSREPARILVVDSSDGDETRLLVESLVKKRGNSKSLEYIHSTPGLPHQRNVGAEKSVGDILHYIDDDTVVDPSYFSEIMNWFERDAERVVGGVCGRIRNLGPHKPNKYAEFFYLDGPDGRLLPSGLNILVFDALLPSRVDWLSGCSMSYRRELVLELRFDDRLAGYALGEDVDFSSRVGEKAELWIQPGAMLDHFESPSERWTPGRKIRIELLHRYHRVTSGIGGQRIDAFWWSVLGQLLSYSGRIVMLRHPRHATRCLLAAVSGVADIVRETFTRGWPA